MEEPGQADKKPTVYGSSEKIRLGQSEFEYKRRFHPYHAIPLLVGLIALLALGLAIFTQNSGWGRPSPAVQRPK